jgi:hypothetical protein
MSALALAPRRTFATRRVWSWTGRLDWRSIAAFALPLALYLRTLAPVVYNLDSAELSVAAATGGIVRATGYPLYLLIGRGWTQIPIGDAAYLMNLFSALCGALTILLADRTLRRLSVGAWASFAALALLACSIHFWALSVVAEVYTLHTALMAGLVLALLRWAERPAANRLAVAALVLGLSLTHHAATVLLLPGCAWFLLTTAPRWVFAPRSLLAGSGAVLLGLSVYLYLPVLHAAEPSFNHAGMYDAQGVFHAVDLQSPSGLWWLVSGKQFSGQMLAYTPREFLGEIATFAQGLWRTFFAVGLVPGLLGVALFTRRNWRLGGALLLMFVLHTAFYAGYRVSDKDTMFLPSYLIWALWTAVGFRWLLDRAVVLQWARVPAHAALIGAVLLTVVVNLPLADQSGETEARDAAVERLAALPPDALVFGSWDTVLVMRYLQLVEGERPDVAAIHRFFITGPDMRTWIRREASRRPVYVDITAVSLPSTWKLVPEAGLHRVQPRSASAGHSDRR